MNKGLPIPHYAIGDKVFVWGITKKSNRHPCPDCLGTGEWPLITPGGGAITVACVRCCSSFSDVPRLDFSEWTPYVRELTIGSVKIDTAYDDPVSYMCVETGVGSGSVYYEKDIADTQAVALALAKLKAGELNTAEETIPTRLEQKRLSHTMLKDAVIAKAQTETRYARRFRDRIEELVEPDDENELRETVQLSEEIRILLSVYERL